MKPKKNTYNLFLLQADVCHCVPHSEPDNVPKDEGKNQVAMDIVSKTSQIPGRGKQSVQCGQYK